MYIEAVRFVCAFKLVDKFPPVFLLKEYLENVRRSARKVCQKKKSFQVKVCFHPPFYINGSLLVYVHLPFYVNEILLHQLLTWSPVTG